MIIYQIDQYYITPRRIFTTLDDLVKHYSQQADGLCCSLTAICPSIPPPVIGLSYKDEGEIERKSITLIKKLGDGTNGGVWEGLWNQTTPVAVRVCEVNSTDVQKLQGEIQMWKKFQHEKIVRFYAVCTVGEPIYIVTEFMKNGNLLDYLQRGEGRHMKLPQLIDVAAQVVSGMTYLEEQHYTHRNLAARTILIGEANVAKIELPVQRNEATYLPNKWTAPEAALHNKFSIKSDVWSFGIFLFELVTHGRVPYPGMTDGEVLSKVEGGYCMPPPPGCPDTLYQMMMNCWKQDPEERPLFEYLKYHLEDFFISVADMAYRILMWG